MDPQVATQEIARSTALLVSLNHDTCVKFATAKRNHRARLNPKSWAVAQHLFDSIPLANAVRLLQVNRFLEIVKIALQDALRCAQNLHHELGPEVKRGDSIMSESSATLDGEIGHGKHIPRKRKRTSITQDTHTKSTSVKGLLSVLRNLTRLLERLIEKSQQPETGSSETASAQDHLRLVLTPDTPLAADLLGYWLDLLVHLSNQNTPKTQDTSSEALEDSLANTSFLRLWSDRSIDEVDNTELAQVFALHQKS
jgi:hypothetical protein